MNITDYIPKGQNNAVSADSLCTALNIDRRTVRRLISSAQENGAVILNMQDGRGYFVPADDESQLVDDYVKRWQSSFEHNPFVREIAPVLLQHNMGSGRHPSGQHPLHTC